MDRYAYDLEIYFNTVSTALIFLFYFLTELKSNASSCDFEIVQDDFFNI